MQPRMDLGPNYSQHEIDNWEMGEAGAAARMYGGYVKNPTIAWRFGDG